MEERPTVSMYKELLTDQENTIIELCKHMRRLITLLERYAEMDREERFLAEVENKHGIDNDYLEEGEE